MMSDAKAPAITPNTLKLLLSEWIRRVNDELPSTKRPSKGWTLQEFTTGRRVPISTSSHELLAKLARVYVEAGWVVQGIIDGDAKHGHDVEMYLLFYPKPKIRE